MRSKLPPPAAIAVNLTVAAAIGFVTVLLCVILADGVLFFHTNPLGNAAFWLFLIGTGASSPFLVKWRYTLVNVFIYYFMYYPINAVDWGGEHFFFQTGGMLKYDDDAYAITMAILLYILQSVIYMGVCLLRIRHRKNKDLRGN